MVGQGSFAYTEMGRDQNASEVVREPIVFVQSSVKESSGVRREPTADEWVVAANAASKAVVAIKAAVQGVGGDEWLRVLGASAMDLSNADPMVSGLAAKMIMTQCIGAWGGEVSLQKAACVFKEWLSPEAQDFVDKALGGA